MMAYKLTTDQAGSLKGVEFIPDNCFNPVVDINGDFFISNEEVEQCENESCLWVKNLIESEYVAPKNELFN